MTAVEERPAVEVGKARKRKEDRRLITGRTRWTDNLTVPGMQHIAMVRSPCAHARITSIDVEEASRATGVVLVLTGQDLADEQGSLPNAWPITDDQKAPPHPAMAVDRVAFAGEIVAAIIARSAAEARDAAELVDVEYDELPVVLDLEAASQEGATLAHPDLGTNVSATWVFDSAEAGSGSDVDDAIRDAEVTIERTYRQQRLMPAYIEPRSVVVDPTHEQITMWSTTQIPHILKLMLALTTDTPESKLRVIAPDVGGGFGGKLQVTPEEVITLLAAKRLARPCKYTETRSENLMAGHH
ncbi:MAG: xanthine dehydrogenase family protein molybdopterin-binding subunit, partial [Nocardioidaceae bacterium]